MISGDWRWIQASALHWPHRPEFHFWAFDLQWWWIGIFDQSMTTHDAFGMAQWQWLKKMWINLHMGMTDDCQAERNALRRIWPELIALLCHFHILQVATHFDYGPDLHSLLLDLKDFPFRWT